MDKLCHYIDYCIANEEDCKDVFGIEAEGSDIYGGKLNHDGYKSVAKQLADKFGFENTINENNFDFKSEPTNSDYNNQSNTFNYSTNNNFKKVKSPKSNPGFGKTVFIPFISGIVGATLVIGACFGVPSIKSKLLEYPSTETSSKLTVNESTSTEGLIDLSDYSNTSVAVAEKVLPSVVGITVTYQISSLFGGSSTGEATGSGIIVSEDGYIVTNNHVISSESSSSFYAISEATGINLKGYNFFSIV